MNYSSTPDRFDSLRLTHGSCVLSSVLGPDWHHTNHAAEGPPLAAARVITLADLGQQMSDRHTGLLGEAAAQMLTVRIDQGGIVLGRTQKIVCRGGADITFDRE
ncbi:hypothetical protein GCM10020219_062120 [Nonomuraea dietziae]